MTVTAPGQSQDLLVQTVKDSDVVLLHHSGGWVTVHNLSWLFMQSLGLLGRLVGGWTM